VQINNLAPTAELEKALQTPTREALQQKADEAVFERRAIAVEKERAIKENELQSEIELARRQEELISQQGQNRLLEIRHSTEADKATVEAQLERDELLAKGASRDAVTRAEGNARSRQIMAEVEADAEAKRVAVWEEAPPKVALGLALQQLAQGIDHIQHLNLTPDLMGHVLQRFLEEQAG
jgi:hypothetical protein